MKKEEIEELKILLLDIKSQSTRNERACSLKRYLFTDLEIIQERAEKALKIIEDV